MKLKDQVQSKQQVLSDFNSHFLLSNEELSALTSGGENIDDEFFQSLVKAKQIHKDSEILLGSESQRLGLEILEQCTKHLNAAFQKLSRWTQQEFKMLDLEDSHLSSTIRRALRVLAERPTLFQDCLDMFAETRQRTLADAFYVALTGSTTDREIQKPIEFSAHEPLRYVGDMLAWAHSTAVSERESLEVLFIAEGNEIAKSIAEGLETEPWSKPESGETFDGRKALSQLINQNLGGVAELLQQRIQMVIHTHGEPVLEYKIANLIVFYRTIFAKLLEGEDFMQTLRTVENAALTQFRDTMRLKISNTDQEEDAIPDSLGIPEFLDEALEELKSLLESYDTSVSMSDEEGLGLDLLLQEALHPWLEVCERLSTSLKAPQNRCFAMNCILASRATLTMFEFTRDEVARLDTAVEDHRNALIHHQHLDFLEKSGMRVLVEAVQRLSDGPPEAILVDPAFSASSLLETREQLDSFLPSASIDSISEMNGLQSTQLSRNISDQAIERFCEDFEKVESVISTTNLHQIKQRGDGDETPTLRELFPRTTEETRILLS